MIKRVFSALVVAMVLYVTAFALPAPTKQFYANDFANVIDAEVENHIVNISAQIEKETGAQIVVAAVNSLDGLTDSEYALKLGREWGIGDEEKDNGVLLLLSMEERSVRIEVGLGLEGALPDGKCGRIIDEEIIPCFAEGDWSQGFLKGYDRIVAEVCAEYAIEIPEEVDALPYDEEDEEGGWIAVITILLMLIIIFNFTKKLPPSHRGGHIGGMFMGYGGFGRGGFGGSGGGFSGGGFSGGGGSFGGGGASRKF